MLTYPVPFTLILAVTLYRLPKRCRIHLILYQFQDQSHQELSSLDRVVQALGSLDVKLILQNSTPRVRLGCIAGFSF